MRLWVITRAVAARKCSEVVRSERIIKNAHQNGEYDPQTGKRSCQKGTGPPFSFYLLLFLLHVFVAAKMVVNKRKMEDQWKFEQGPVLTRASARSI